MIARISLLVLLMFLVNSSTGSGTDVKKCTGDMPFPLEVRVLNCVTPPCYVYKGTVMEFEIDFVAWKFITSMKALVKATTLGFTVPYTLPDDVSDVCSNLLYGAYCPLYREEDVTYHFRFPIEDIYPEISVKIEISIVDQDSEIVTCFLCDIKVRKGPTNGFLIG